MAISILTRRTAGAALLFMMACISANAADDFYGDRLEAAQIELRAGNNLDAEDDLRLAAFGMLNNPESLIVSEALLSIARSRLGRQSESIETMERFVRLESRFQVYSPTLLLPEFRREFEALLKKSVAKETLARIASLAPIVGAAPARQNDVKSQFPRSAPSPAPGPPPSAKPAGRAMASEADYADYQRAKTLLSQGKSGEAVTLLSALVRRATNVRLFRLTLLQALVFTSDWELAAGQVALLLPFTDSEAAFTFYGAVAMYHVQKIDEARSLLNQALPRLVPSPFVTSYVERIRSNS
ncbi:MAG: hypothetical protein ABI718_18050 [Acidobacteriota bacterium]